MQASILGSPQRQRTYTAQGVSTMLRLGVVVDLNTLKSLHSVDRLSDNATRQELTDVRKKLARSSPRGPGLGAARHFPRHTGSWRLSIEARLRQERAQQRLDTAASILIQRQDEVASFARASMQVKGAFDFSLIGRQLSLDIISGQRLALSNAERDTFFVVAAQRVQKHGFGEGSSLPPKLQAWLCSSGGEQFLDKQVHSM